jgi:hypothetical protein
MGKSNTMKVDERRHRDTKVMQLYLAGATYREIAQLLGLKCPGSVELYRAPRVVQGGDRRDLLASGH